MPHEHPHFTPTSLRAAIAIRNATENPDANEHEIEALVASEPGVASAMLRFANSAAYHHRGDPITSIWQAMRLLGLGTVRAIASHIAMMQIVRGLRTPAIREAADALYQHVVAISCLAEECAIEFGDEPPGHVAAEALFHEMPLFDWLVSVDHTQLAGCSREALEEAAQAARLRDLSSVLLDLGLPEFAMPTYAELALIDAAHAVCWQANPLLDDAVEPDPKGPTLSEGRVATARERTEALMDLVGAHLGEASEHGQKVLEDVSALTEARERTLQAAAPVVRPQKPEGYLRYIVLLAGALSAISAVAWWIGR